MVRCEDCRHFRRLPGDTTFRRRTGCYHPELMEQKQSERFNAAQEIPGNHEIINLNGDCAKFEAQPRRSWVKRLVSAMKS
jgi:hypothetical protein